MHGGNDRQHLPRSETLPALYNPGIEADDGTNQEWDAKEGKGDSSLQQEYQATKPPRGPSKKRAVAGGNRVSGKEWRYGSDEGESTDDGEDPQEVMLLRTRRAAASPVITSQPRSTRMEVSSGQPRRRHARAMRRSRSLQPFYTPTSLSVRRGDKGPQTDVHAALINTGTPTMAAVNAINVAALEAVAAGVSTKRQCCRHAAHKKQARRRRQARRVLVRIMGLLLRAVGVMFYALLCGHLVHAYRRNRSSLWDTGFGLYFCSTSLLLLLITAATPTPRPLPSPGNNIASPACCTCCGGDTCKEHGVLGWVGRLLASHSFWYGTFIAVPLVLAAGCLALALYTGTYRPSMLKGLVVLVMPSLVELGRVASYSPPPTPRV